MGPMSTRAPGDDLPVRRIDRILAFMSLGLVILTIALFFAILIGTSAGANFSTGVWPAVGIVVYIAPIVAFVLMFIVLITAFVRRARANKDR